MLHTPRTDVFEYVYATGEQLEEEVMEACDRIDFDREDIAQALDKINKRIAATVEHGNVDNEYNAQDLQSDLSTYVHLVEYMMHYFSQYTKKE